MCKLNILGDPNDAFWLAQTHFLTGHYLRAERLLTLPLSLSSTRLPRREGLINGIEKGKGKLRVDNEDGEEDGVSRGKLVDESLACRYLAAQCLVSYFQVFVVPEGIRLI